MSQLIYLGTVTSVCDEYSGNRIRVKIPLDGNKEPAEGWPHAFPLLPKTIQAMPKVGEMVFVMLSNPEIRNSARFYIGPIISQPQKIYSDEKGVFDNPACLIGNSNTSPLETISHFTETFGSFPRTEDIGLVGRKSEDIILKDDEINIRCGVRNNADGSDNESLVGNIIFNSTNPSYIQLKHRRGSGKLGNNLINLVGSNINLMSNDDAKKITEYMKNLNNVKTCIDEEVKKSLYKAEWTEQDLLKKYGSEVTNSTYSEPDYDELMVKLHQVPYGDVLVRILEIIRKAILQHTHPWAQLPPTAALPALVKLQTWGESTDESSSVDLNELLLSKTVRTS